MWLQPGSGSRQDCLQGGQGPGWHRWVSLVGWWQDEGHLEETTDCVMEVTGERGSDRTAGLRVYLQDSLQRGGLVLRSRPQGTTKTDEPHVHRTSTVSGQG